MHFTADYRLPTTDYRLSTTYFLPLPRNETGGQMNDRPFLAVHIWL